MGSDILCGFALPAVQCLMKVQPDVYTQSNFIRDMNFPEESLSDLFEKSYFP